MSIREIPADQLDPQQFIAEQVAAIAAQVGEDTAINALSGGVDSAVVTMLGHRALGDRLKNYFIDNALMRVGEPEHVVGIFPWSCRSGCRRARGAPQTRPGSPTRRKARGGATDLLP